MRTFGIIGGGITGLAAALRVRELAPDVQVHVWEKQGRFGGSLWSERIGPYLVEKGADMFLARLPWGLALCRKIGLEEQLVPTRPQYRKAYIVRAGKLYPVPAGFALMTTSRPWSLLASPLLSWPGKLRLLAEYFVPARHDVEEESLAQFARRRFGEETYRWLIQPLVSGIYTADPERLSVAAALPQFWQMESRYGSLLKGAWKQRRTGQHDPQARGVRYSMFVAPRQGMQQLVDTLLERLAGVHLHRNTIVHSVCQQGTGWSVQTDSGTHRVDRLVIATPAWQAGNLLRGVHTELAQMLHGIPYASAVVAAAVVPRKAVRRGGDAIGIVIPLAEGRPILALSMASNKFPDRAPEDQLLLRVFAGGACRPEVLDWTDAQLEQCICRELEEILRLQMPPRILTIARWNHAMPQYEVGHLERVRRIESFVNQLPALALAGSPYRGVGIPYCIHSGEAAAERLLGVSPEPEKARSP